MQLRKQIVEVLFGFVLQFHKHQREWGPWKTLVERQLVLFSLALHGHLQTDWNS
jgi:hypothetical protein